MANGKVTLAELHAEAARVGCVASPWTSARQLVRDGKTDWKDIPICTTYVGKRCEWLEVSGSTRMDARRRMLKLLRALPDGALKEG